MSGTPYSKDAKCKLAYTDVHSDVLRGGGSLPSEAEHCRVFSAFTSNPPVDASLAKTSSCNVNQFMKLAYNLKLNYAKILLQNIYKYNT